MANPFIKNYPSPHKLYEQKYKTSRTNLLIVAILTAINLLLLVTNSTSYFPFSAFIPYFLTGVGMLVSGLLPEEDYTVMFEETGAIDNSAFVILLVISLIIILAYLLTWFMSGKQRVGCLIFALVLFSIDTLGMLFINGVSFDWILDILFHAWVIYSLIAGISAHYKLKKLPPEEEPTFFDGATAQ